MFLRTWPKKGVYAEIGVWKGDNAQMMLNILQPQELVLVDSWVPVKTRDRISGAKARAHLEAYWMTKGRFQEHPEVKVIRQASPAASAFYGDEYFDGIYIDGLHTEEAVTADLEAWWPKVKLGGILGGHDYEMKPRRDIFAKKAVDDFCERHGLRLNIITRPQNRAGDRNRSWGIIKQIQ